MLIVDLILSWHGTGINKLCCSNLWSFCGCLNIILNIFCLHNFLCPITLLSDCAAFILMEYLKTKGKDSSLVPDGCAAVLDHCNLLKCNVEEIMSVEELKACIGADSKKRRKR